MILRRVRDFRICVTYYIVGSIFVMYFTLISFLFFETAISQIIWVIIAAINDVVFIVCWIFVLLFASIRA